MLFNTFGEDSRCLYKFWNKSIVKGKPFLTQFHFSNEAGRRAGTLDKNDFYYTLNIDQYNSLLEKMPKELEGQIRRRVTEILQLTEGYEAYGTFILSAGLEDNYTTKAWENLYLILSAEWPYQISRNPAFTKPMRKQKWEIPENLILEHHGYDRKLNTDRLCIANGDGQDLDILKGGGLDFRNAKAADQKKLDKWLTKAKEKNCITFLWAGKWQGWFNPKKALPPLQRKFLFNKEDISILSEILKPAN